MQTKQYVPFLLTPILNMDTLISHTKYNNIWYIMTNINVYSTFETKYLPNMRHTIKPVQLNANITKRTNNVSHVTCHTFRSSKTSSRAENTFFWQ